MNATQAGTVDRITLSEADRNMPRWNDTAIRIAGQAAGKAIARVLNHVGVHLSTNDARTLGRLAAWTAVTSGFLVTHLDAEISRRRAINADRLANHRPPAYDPADVDNLQVAFSDPTGPTC